MNQEGNPYNHDKPVRYRALNDAVIRYTLCGSESKEKLKAFLNAVLADADGEEGGIVIEDLTILNPFNPKTFQTEKQPVLDMLVVDNRKRKFHMEFQVLDHASFTERCLFYWSKVYAQMIKKGDKYWELNPVISVIVTDFQSPRLLDDPDRPDSLRIRQSCSIRFDNPPHRRLTDHFRMHFVQLPKKINPETIAEVHPQLGHWLAFFGYPNKTKENFMSEIASIDPNIQSAIDAYNRFHMDPELRFIAESCEDHQRDINAYGKTQRMEGEKKKAIEMLLRILTKRLGPLPKNLTAQLTALTDMEEIDRLADIALDVPSLKEFENHLS